MIEHSLEPLRIEQAPSNALQDSQVTPTANSNGAMPMSILGEAGVEHFLTPHSTSFDGEMNGRFERKQDDGRIRFEDELRSTMSAAEFVRVEQKDFDSAVSESSEEEEPSFSLLQSYSDDEEDKKGDKKENSDDISVVQSDVNKMLRSSDGQPYIIMSSLYHHFIIIISSLCHHYIIII